MFSPKSTGLSCSQCGGVDRFEIGGGDRPRVDCAVHCPAASSASSGIAVGEILAPTVKADLTGVEKGLNCAINASTACSTRSLPSSTSPRELAAFRVDRRHVAVGVESHDVREHNTDSLAVDNVKPRRQRVCRAVRGAEFVLFSIAVPA